MDRVLYTAEAVVEGGRAGHGRTSDGRLDVALSVPKELSGDGGPGTNPEQLFAVGYAACFQSALLGVARGRNLDVSDSRITSRVGLGPTGMASITCRVASVSPVAVIPACSARPASRTAANPSATGPSTCSAESEPPSAAAPIRLCSCSR